MSAIDYTQLMARLDKVWDAKHGDKLMRQCRGCNEWKDKSQFPDDRIVHHYRKGTNEYEELYCIECKWEIHSKSALSHLFAKENYKVRQAADKFIDEQVEIVKLKSIILRINNKLNAKLKQQ